MNTLTQKERIIGSVLASALGDALGAPYEGGIPERMLWAVLTKEKGKLCWTDDTNMSIDVIESLTVCGQVDQDDLAQRFARSYRWSRGYGPGAAKLLKRIRQGEDWRVANRAVYPDGSYGNGGAMRVAPVGLFYGADREKELVQAARAAAQVTHAHPLGQEGAVLIALAAALACNGAESSMIMERLQRQTLSVAFQNRLETAAAWLQEGIIPDARTVTAELGNGIAAVNSCVTAVWLALAFHAENFADLIRSVRQIGGDVDTIGAMAGGIWGAACGQQALPEKYLQQLEQRRQLEGLGITFAQAIADRL